MAMSIGDAQDIQWVIDFVTGDPKVDRVKFEEVLCRLADRSQKVLMAGESGDSLRPVLARRRFGTSSHRAPRG